MPRAGVTVERIIAEAAKLADERGLEQITLAELASRLGVRVPSLYKHVGGLQQVHTHLANECRTELATVMEQATIGRGGRLAIEAIAHAIRAWALEHPGRYNATVRAETTGEDPTPGTRRATSVLLKVIDPDQQLEPAELVHRARLLRSAVHGFVDLELRGGFGLPVAIDESFQRLVTQVATEVMPEGGG